MSSPGYFMGDDDFAKNQMMAQLLAGNKPQGQQNPLAPLNSAIMMAGMRAGQNRQQGQDFANQRLAAAGSPPVQLGWGSGISGLFGLGGK